LAASHVKSQSTRGVAFSHGCYPTSSISLSSCS
jgi:hypothetical protein